MLSFVKQLIGFGHSDLKINKSQRKFIEEIKSSFTIIGIKNKDISAIIKFCREKQSEFSTAKRSDIAMDLLRDSTELYLLNGTHGDLRKFEKSMLPDLLKIQTQHRSTFVFF